MTAPVELKTVSDSQPMCKKKVCSHTHAIVSLGRQRQEDNEDFLAKEPSLICELQVVHDCLFKKSRG